MSGNGIVKPFAQADLASQAAEAFNRRVHTLYTHLHAIQDISTPSVNKTSDPKLAKKAKDFDDLPPLAELDKAKQDHISHYVDKFLTLSDEAGVSGALVTLDQALDLLYNLCTDKNHHDDEQAYIARAEAGLLYFYEALETGGKASGDLLLGVRSILDTFTPEAAHAHVRDVYELTPTQ